jgi:putative nucleotidyltransferase with HDIG domain
MSQPADLAMQKDDPPLDARRAAGWISRAELGIIGALLVPALSLVALRAIPTWDIEFNALWFHFEVVSFISLAAFVVGILIAHLAGSVGDVRALFVTFAFTAIAGIFLIHGLATLGFILPLPNRASEHAHESTASADEYGEYTSPSQSAPPIQPRPSNAALAVMWSSPISLFVGAVLLLLAMAPWSSAMQRRILERRRLWWWLGVMAYALYVLMAFVLPEPLLFLNTLSPLSQYALVGVTVSLYLVTALKCWQAYRKRRQYFDAALVVAAGLLAEAVIIIVTMPLWHLSWWLYHLLMLGAFLVAMGAVALTYERVRYFDLTRYFAATSVITIALLALVAGEVAQRVLAPWVLPTQIVQAQLGVSGIFVGVAGLLLLVLLVVVRRGDLLLKERTRMLLRQQAVIERGRMAEALVPIGLAMGGSLDLDRVLDIVCAESLRLFEVDGAYLWLKEGNQLIGRAGYGDQRSQFLGLREPLDDVDTWTARIITGRKPLLVNYATTAPELNPAWVAFFNVRAIMGVPLLNDDGVLGALMLVDTQHDECFTPQDLEVATIFGQQAALALKHAQLYATVKRQLQDLTTLHAVSTTLRQATQRDEVIAILLQQAMSALSLTGSAVMLKEAEGDEAYIPLALGTLTAACDMRFPWPSAAAENGLASHEPELFITLAQDERFPLTLRECIAREQMGLTFPMQAGGRTVGALCMAFPPHHTPSADEQRLSQTIAEIGGIAIHRMSLHEQTQQQAEALAHALTGLRDSYQATLTALSAALDARDRETEGHSRRVTAYALALADALGIMDATQRESLEMGALLHDVGKIGVPDAILLKPGKLTDEEWQLMRQHPAIGYRILRDIPFLQRALAVVQYHHERWDGAGYPHRLTGDAIPLPARIFAVADTLDAMTTNRPYRAAAPFAVARQEIVRLRGVQFDPRVVDAFATIRDETWQALAQQITGERNVQA